MFAISLLGLKLQANGNQRVLVDVDCSQKVALLKENAAEKFSCTKDDLVLSYCGNILKEEEILSKCGIKPGVTVHVLRKVNKEPQKTTSLPEAEVLQLYKVVRNFKLSPNYRAALQRLTRPEVIRNLISSTPGLNKDLVALAVLQDPELLVQLSDIQVLRRVAELHPSLAEVTSQMIVLIHEDVASVTSSETPSTSTGYSYSLEALSDDEMDSSNSDLPSPITPAQVAAAMAEATQNLNNTGGNASVTSSASPIFTSEMFSTAMQQVQRRYYGSQLRQMHEMGLPDEAINFQALQMTSGDIQSAVELVLSGALNNTN